MSRSLLGRTLTFVLTQYCDDKYFFLMVLTAAKKKEKNIIAYISLSSVLTPGEKKDFGHILLPLPMPSCGLYS